MDALLGEPIEVYRAAGIPEDTAKNLTVLSLYLKRTTSGILYPIATRLRANGNVDVLFPQLGKNWMPYAKAGPELGYLFATTRLDNKGRVPRESDLCLSSEQLLRFAAHTLTEGLDTPTIALVNAPVWRDKDKGMWEQLKNHAPFVSDVLDFGPKNPFGQPYKRNNPKLANLLAVLRVRSDMETPQYITTASEWETAKNCEIPVI